MVFSVGVLAAWTWYFSSGPCSAPLRASWFFLLQPWCLGLSVRVFAGCRRRLLVVRYLIRDDDDIFRTVRAFAVFSIIIAGFMIFEKVHQVDVLAFLAVFARYLTCAVVPCARKARFSTKSWQEPSAPRSCACSFCYGKVGNPRCLGIVAMIACTVIVGVSSSSNRGNGLRGRAGRNLCLASS